MPFDPQDLFSGTIILCDRVLQEKDGTLSAIRIFDLMRVSGGEPAGVRVQAVILLKTNLESKHHLFEMSAEDPEGTVVTVTPAGEPLYIDFASRTKLGSKPGAQIAMELAIGTKAEGTYILRALVDGQEIAAAALTLQFQPVPHSEASPQ